MSSRVGATSLGRICAGALLCAALYVACCSAQATAHAGTQANPSAPADPNGKHGKAPDKVQDAKTSDGSGKTAPIAVTKAPVVTPAPAVATGSAGQTAGGSTPGSGTSPESGIQPPDAGQLALDAAKLQKDEAELKLLNADQLALLESGKQIPPSASGIFVELPWLLPAISALLGLIAIVIIFEVKRRAGNQLARQKSLMNDLQYQLGQAEQELLTRSTPVASPGPAEKTSRQSPASRGVMRPVETAELAEDMTRVAAVGANSYPSERESKGIAPARPAVAAAPDPRKASGDIVADYNKARGMGDDGAEWFKENYTWLGLSCTNLNERLLHPNATLLFQEESRGSFLAVSHRGEMRVVPALDKELEVSSSFLAGVFDYPPQINGPLVLFRAASIEKSGGLWQLRQSGEIKLER